MYGDLLTYTHCYTCKYNNNTATYHSDKTKLKTTHRSYVYYASANERERHNWSFNIIYDCVLFPGSPQQFPPAGSPKPSSPDLADDIFQTPRPDEGYSPAKTSLCVEHASYVSKIMTPPPTPMASTRPPSPTTLEDLLSNCLVKRCSTIEVLHFGAVLIGIDHFHSDVELVTVKLQDDEKYRRLLVTNLFEAWKHLQGSTEVDVSSLLDAANKLELKKLHKCFLVNARLYCAEADYTI